MYNCTVFLISNHDCTVSVQSNVAILSSLLLPTNQPTNQTGIVTSSAACENILQNCWATISAIVANLWDNNLIISKLDIIFDINPRSESQVL